MEIVYFWIKEFRNIKNLGYNFGSEYIFDVQGSEGEFVISRIPNNNYIRDFFSFNRIQSDVINLSAIVGDNGSGKTNTLEALKRALTGIDYYFDHIIIYKYVLEGEPKFYVHSALEDETLQVEFEHSEQIPSFDEVIFYSPTLDLSNYPIQSETSIGIDISSNWLMYADSKDQTFARDNLNIVEYHKTQDTLRHIKLLNEGILAEALSTKINIPQKLTVQSIRTNFSHDATDSSEVRNVPYNLREYHNILRDKSNIVNQIAKEEERIRKSNGEYTPEYLNLRRMKCFAFFLYHLTKNLFYHLEKTNHWLQEGKVKIAIDEINKLEHEEAIIAFLQNQNLFDAKAVITFIAVAKNSIFKGNPQEVSNDYCSWSISPRESEILINAYGTYLYSLEKFSDFGPPNGFIDFDWSGLSTGEKTFFNLFSRFYFAKFQVLNNREKGYSNKPKPLPHILYILIDEGELGFHLQWQKDYVKELITWLPELLSIKDGHEKYTPKIQLIFATHSPISLSDVPNSHIIYLKKNFTNKITSVLEGLERPSKSFGANVHTLMAHSFFLDGLVGKLAVNKINGVIAILNNENSSAEDLQIASKIISIIDEPLLKKQLELQLAQRMGKSEKDFLEMELARIQERLRNL